MRRNLIAAGLVLVAFATANVGEDYNSPEWKDEIARGYLPYRKLTVDDFPVSDQDHSTHWMHTECFFHYQLKAKWTEMNGEIYAEVTQFRVRSGFDQNKSWRKPGVNDAPDLLKHEQGHLDISELHANEFRAMPLPTVKAATSQLAIDGLKAKVQTACEKYLREAQAEQDQYDRETNHGLNTTQQKLWNKALERRLGDARITYWDKAG